MTPDDRYSGVMPRVLIVLALGFLAGLVIPVACHGQEGVVRGGARCSRICVPTLSDTAGGTRLSALTHSRNLAQFAPNFKPDGTTFARDTTPPDTLPVLSDSAKLAALDSVHALMAKIDSILARTAPWPADPVLLEPRVEVGWRTKTYAGGIVVALVANEVFKLDQDLCPTGKRVCFTTNYPDKFLAQDKVNHFSSAYFLTNAASDFGVPKWAAFGLTCGLAGPGFEYTQGGYISLKDIAADCAGSATALGLQSLLRKMHDAGWLR